MMKNLIKILTIVEILRYHTLSNQVKFYQIGDVSEFEFEKKRKRLMMFPIMMDSMIPIVSDKHLFWHLMWCTRCTRVERRELVWELPIW